MKTAFRAPFILAGNVFEGIKEGCTLKSNLFFSCLAIQKSFITKPSLVAYLISSGVIEVIPSI